MASRSHDHTNFFNSLPANDLLPMEQVLRKVLIDWLYAKPGPFPLTEWIDRRIGGEVEARRNARGGYELYLRAGAPPPPPAGGHFAPYTASGVPFAPSGMPPLGPPGLLPGGPPPPPGRSGPGSGTSAPPAAPAPPRRPGVSGTSREEFFRRLPSDRFRTYEVNLRDAVFEFLATWRSQDLATTHDLREHAQVRRATEAFLPKDVPLEDWIERRIGGEVELRSGGPRGAQLVCLTAEGKRLVREKFDQISSGAQAPAEAPSGKDAFFSTLPEDELTNEELALRQAIFDFLTKWSRTKKIPPTITELQSDPKVTQCRNALMPAKVKLRLWLERRIGGEVELKKIDGPGAGDHFVAIRGQMPAVLPKQDGPAAIPKAEAQKPAQAANQKQAAALTAAAFFASLPEDELTDGEQELRLAVMDQLTGKATPPAVTEVQWAFKKDPALLKILRAVLPADNVPLQAWVNRRIGGEVEVTNDEKGRQVMRLRGEELSKVGAAATETKAVVQETEDLDAEELEAFFTSLPSDEFLPDEESLREALLAFLGKRRRGEAVTVGQARADKDVAQYVGRLLPPDYKAVTLGQWIARRIGGEIEVGNHTVDDKKTLKLVGAAASAPPPQDNNAKRRRV